MGRVFGILLQVHWTFILIIALFVYFGASSEYRMIQQMSVLKGHKVKEAMKSEYTPLQPGDSLKKVGEVLLSGDERHFIVKGENGSVAGVLYNKSIKEAFQSQRTDASVADLMDKDFKTIKPNEGLGEVYRSVQRRRHNFFPVMDDGALVGVIDMENINEFMMIEAALDY